MQKTQNLKLFLLCILATGIFSFTSVNLKAQYRTFKVSGTVSDQNRIPLIGATVKEKGSTTLGTITDENGAFSISVTNSNSVLIITSIGMKRVEIALKGKNFIKVFMEDSDVLLKDVVVTALGIKRQTKALGYAVSEVSGDDVTSGRDANIMSAISGKVAGVDISGTTAGPSGSTRVVIRGNSQLTGSNMPLYVIDGTPMDNTQLGSVDQWGGYDMGDGLSSISPEDIESISVLKGASASALYGSRASNGVVLITTKSAKKENDLNIDVSLNVNGVILGSYFDDYQREYGQGHKGRLITQYTEARTSSQSAWGAKLDPTLTVPIYNGKIKPYGNVNNNILSFFRTGVTTTNSVGLSKGNDDYNFRFSISDLRNWDIVPESDMSRTTFMLKGGAKLNSKIRIDSRINYTHEKVNNRPALSDSPNNIGNALIGLAPNFDQKWLSESYKDEFGRYNQWNGNEYRLNPYWIINEMTNVSVKDRVMGNIQMNYNILPNLTARLKAGTDFYKFRATEFIPVYTPVVRDGSMSEHNINVYENNYEAMLMYNQRFDDTWELSAFVGGNIMQYESESFLNTARGQVDKNTESILNYDDYSLDYSMYRKQVNSVYSSVNISYRYYAYLDATLRRDVSSTLAKDNRAYMYPSVSGSFIFSSFFGWEDKALSFGKIRASWAKVGGDTDPYRLNLVYGLRPFSFQGNPLGQVASWAIPSPNLKPTSTYSYEFGFDMRFFNNRLGMDFGYYNQTTKDQILNLPISKASGYNYATINAGEITNKGIEVSLNAKPIETSNFTWTTTVNLAKNINKVEKLHESVSNYELASARWAGASIYAMAGEVYGVIVGNKFQRDPDGNIIFDNEGMPTYNSNLSIMGKGTYDFTMGLANSFSYKNFHLSALLDMKWGADIFSMSDMQAHANGTSKKTLEGRKEWYESEELRLSQNVDEYNWKPTGGYIGKGVKNIGTAENPEYVANDTPVDPQIYWSNVNQNTPEPYIFDASYIKLRELTLSYNIPAKFLSKSFIKELSITAYGRNLWIIHTKLKNIDPESNYNNGNGQGLEYGSLPTRRTYGLGINLKF